MRRILQRVYRRLVRYLDPPPPDPRIALEEAGRLEVGHRTYGAFRVMSYDRDACVRIGAWTSIADDVVFMPGGNHLIDRVTTYPMRIRFDLPSPDDPWTKGDIVVGNDVWLGRGARVLSGVTIGDGAVVAGWSLVTRDVAPYTIVGGNPAREIGRRLTVDQAEAMARIAWWDWDEAVIRERVDEFASADVDAFIARYDPGD